MESQVRETTQTDRGTLVEDDLQTGMDKDIDGAEKIDFDITKCNACGDCLEVCPVDALSIYHKDFVIQEECTGCGKCVKVCDKNALQFDGKEE